MGSGPSSPSGPSAPSSPSTPSTPSAPNVASGFDRTQATSNPFNSTQPLTIGQISDAITAPNPVARTSPITFTNLSNYITNSTIARTVGSYRSTTLKTLLTYTATSLSPVQHQGWSFHINNQTVVGNNTTTFYSYIVVPISLSAKARLIPTITLVHNAAGTITTNVRYALYDNYTAGTSGYANNGIGGNAQRHLSSQMSISVPNGGTGASVQFNDLIPAYYSNLTSTLNAFVAIGVSDTSAQWKGRYTFSVQFHTV